MGIPIAPEEVVSWIVQTEARADASEHYACLPLVGKWYRRRAEKFWQDGRVYRVGLANMGRVDLIPPIARHEDADLGPVVKAEETRHGLRITTETPAARVTRIVLNEETRKELSTHLQYLAQASGGTISEGQLASFWKAYEKARAPFRFPVRPPDPRLVLMSQKELNYDIIEHENEICGEDCPVCGNVTDGSRPTLMRFPEPMPVLPMAVPPRAVPLAPVRRRFLLPHFRPLVRRYGPPAATCAVMVLYGFALGCWLSWICMGCP